MSTWKANLFVNSRVGKICTEVQASTFQGAKDQIYAKHGDVQQILNISRVTGGSSNSDSDSSSMLLGIAALFLIGAIIKYWYIIAPVSIIVLILYYFSTRN
jgi:hypothetical protein